GAHLDPDLLLAAEEMQIAVFRTPMVTMRFINAATIAMEADFSPTVTEFGSMVDILGVGVLIRGASGVGKSECVLGLIERGYSLVADDVTRIKSFEGRELMATAPDLTRYHMEVRGIGSSTSLPFSASEAFASRSGSTWWLPLRIGRSSRKWTGSGSTRN